MVSSSLPLSHSPSKQSWVSVAMTDNLLRSFHAHVSRRKLKIKQVRTGIYHPVDSEVDESWGMFVYSGAYKHSVNL